jgi:CspA family cold shock protein
MTSGTVKWFNGQKGYGFIQPDDGSKDVFVHISAVERAGLTFLSENQKLSYELERGQQGKTSAVNLQSTCWRSIWLRINLLWDKPCTFPPELVEVVEMVAIRLFDYSPRRVAYFSTGSRTRSMGTSASSGRIKPNADN